MEVWGVDVECRCGDNADFLINLQRTVNFMGTFCFHRLECRRILNKLPLRSPRIYVLPNADNGLIRALVRQSWLELQAVNFIIDHEALSKQGDNVLRHGQSDFNCFAKGLSETKIRTLSVRSSESCLTVPAYRSNRTGQFGPLAPFSQIRNPMCTVQSENV